MLNKQLGNGKLRKGKLGNKKIPGVSEEPGIYLNNYK